MNIRITPRGWPTRTDLYGGVDAVLSNGTELCLFPAFPNSQEPTRVPLADVAEIALDDELGMWW